MYGFGINNLGIKHVMNAGFKKNDVIETHTVSNYEICRVTSAKFHNDKVCFESEKYIIILEGVILNKTELCSQYNADWNYTVISMINEEGKDYFDRFRGNFCGAHYDKVKKEWVVYTNTYEDKPVYYYVKNEAFIVSTEVEYIAKVLKDSRISFTLDQDAVYEMLSFGYMVEGRTYINEIKKLPYGCYIEKPDDGSLSVRRYYDYAYCDTEEQQDEYEIVDKLDSLFRRAVKLQFMKDNEYGYRHVANLSGGLDSRMVVWVASDMGYADMLNINFCQSDYLDETVAKQVSQHLGTELVVKSLNDGKFMLDYDYAVKSNNGMSIYSGMSHSNSILKYLDLEEFGMIHTGDLGDAIVGVYDKEEDHDTLYPGAYSTKLASRINAKLEPSTIGVEKFMMTNRGYGGVVQSMVGQDSYCESMSPFLYRDFFDYCIGEVPKSLRKSHYIYKKWVQRQYPTAAEIPLERYGGGKMDETNAQQLLRKAKRMGVFGVSEWLLWRMGIKKELKRKITAGSMNPFDFYYDTNVRVRSQMDSEFERIMVDIKGSVVPGKIIRDMDKLYERGTAIEKTQVITAAAAIKLLFC